MYILLDLTSFCLSTLADEIRSLPGDTITVYKDKADITNKEGTEDKTNKTLRPGVKIVFKDRKIFDETQIQTEYTDRYEITGRIEMLSYKIKDLYFFKDRYKEIAMMNQDSSKFPMVKNFFNRIKKENIHTADTLNQAKGK